MTDILDEILSEQQYEKRLLWFKKYLPIIICTTAFIAILIFCYNWHNSKTKAKNVRVSDILTRIIYNDARGENIDSDDLNKIIEQDETKVSELAAIEQVNTQKFNNNLTQAKKALEKIIDNKNYSDVTIAYASIVWLSMIIEEDKLNLPDPDRLKKVLLYFNNEEQPFFGTGNILKALLYIKAEQKDLAISTLETILSSKYVSPSIKEQARAIMSTSL